MGPILAAKIGLAGIVDSKGGPCREPFLTGLFGCQKSVEWKGGIEYWNDLNITNV